MDQKSQSNSTAEHVPNHASSAQITVVEGAAKGARFRITGTTTVGRSPEATVVIEDAGVSRLHVRLARTESGAFSVEDLGSRNGTFVNGRRVNRHQLAFGDKIRLGHQTAFEFHGFDPVEDYIIQRQHFEALGRLTVGVAHDLNNVLATFEAGTSYLQQLPSTTRLEDPDATECVTDLILAVKRASDLTHSIVSFARGIGMQRTRVDLSLLVAEVVRMLRHAFPRSIRVEIETTPKLCVFGARSELYQVLLNLCFNSRDAMPDGGTLKITAGVDHSPPSELGFRLGQSVAVLSVSDSGTGMDAATQARVFDLFYTTKRGGLGYGLGLSTVREIVTLHDGKIALQSAPGCGTKFTIQLPIHPEEIADGTDQSRSAVVTLVPQGFVSVLLVDDDPVVRRAIARRLRQAGLDVDEAVDGHQAVSMFEEREYRLIVLDFDMPELDGLETQARLLEINSAARIVFATGYASPERLAVVRTSGALGLLEKPYRIDALIKFANDVFPQEQMTLLDN